MTYDITIEQVKSLLSRFYEGKTTPEEELLLAEFFRGEDIPEELQQDKKLFLLLGQTSEQEMPQDIADEITAFVNNLEKSDKKLIIPFSKQRKGIKPRLRIPPKILYRVAATGAILLAIGGGMWHYQQTVVPFRDTCANAQEAAQEILYANEIFNRSLVSLQESILTANTQIDNLQETINKANQYINY